MKIKISEILIKMSGNSRFYGVIIYKYNDHNPPHFHVWYNGY